MLITISQYVIQCYSNVNKHVQNKEYTYVETRCVSLLGTYRFSHILQAYIMNTGWHGCLSGSEGTLNNTGHHVTWIQYKLRV